MISMPSRGVIIDNFSGKVTELDMGGVGPNSGQLEFSVTSSGGQGRTFAVWMDTEARVVSAMTSILAMAFQSGISITVNYMEIEGGTPKAINVRVPAIG
jgi:hypothetical protein